MICFFEAEMIPTERFSNRAEDYRRYRPGYPVAVVDLIRDTCGLKTGAPLADIGSGTGIFTKLLLEAGFDVTAVEPNEAMRLAAEQGRFLSASYVPAKGDPRHEDYLLRLKQIFDKHAANGHVTFDQTTEVYYGKLTAKL
jgi:SAM-dependent methyltransferase